MSKKATAPEPSGTPQPAPEEQPASEKKPLSDRKKTALLRYMAILFAVAFVLVLMSLVLQMHNSQATISQLHETNSNALTNAEQLQAQNRDLQQEKTDLQTQLDDLQKQLDDEKAQNETLQKANDEAAQKLTDAEQTSEKELAHTQEAYDALLTAVSCTTREGNVTFSKAMDTLKTLHIYLSDNARTVYESLLAE